MKKWLLSISVLSLTAAAAPNVTFAATNASSSNPSSQADTVTLNSQEQSLLRNLPTTDQSFFLSLANAEKGNKLQQFMNDNSSRISSFKSEHKDFMTQMFEYSDAIQYLGEVGKISVKSDGTQTTTFPDGSTLTITSTDTPVSAPTINDAFGTSLLHSIGVVRPSTPLRFNDTYVGAPDDYVHDNDISIDYAGGYDECDYRDYYDAKWYTESNGTAGYGADIYQTYPGATSTGYGAVCTYITHNIADNNAPYASDTADYTIGFNVNGATSEKTWQLETYWSESTSTYHPFQNDITPAPLGTDPEIQNHSS